MESIKLVHNPYFTDILSMFLYLKLPVENLANPNTQKEKPKKTSDSKK